MSAQHSQGAMALPLRPLCSALTGLFPKVSTSRAASSSRGVINGETTARSQASIEVRAPMTASIASPSASRRRPWSPRTTETQNIVQTEEPPAPPSRAERPFLTRESALVGRFESRVQRLCRHQLDRVAQNSNHARTPRFSQLAWDSARTSSPRHGVTKVAEARSTQSTPPAPRSAPQHRFLGNTAACPGARLAPALKPHRVRIAKHSALIRRPRCRMRHRPIRRRPVIMVEDTSLFLPSRPSGHRYDYAGIRLDTHDVRRNAVRSPTHVANCTCSRRCEIRAPCRPRPQSHRSGLGQRAARR